MSNMAYCRYENTVRDLKDCEEHMEDTTDLSAYEKKARAELIEICKRIAADYGDETT